ncbi:alpha/beta hydrolase [Subtercola endophyticus]|uniref:alpha/beta hydrolase n=1 Tax=Subtercola endophyticus TaxID=2895559 RepID=UPI001E317013|nr:alpha/beta hydrolase [Subtercola endophyticus]UFS59230.1 alpha/beta hydrolase [Subtercola endophyticus]
MSLTMAATRGLLRLTPKRTATAESLLEALPRRKAPAPVTAAVHRVAHVEESVVEGRPVIRLTPKAGASGAELLYTHGGAYVNPILATHWRILATLVASSGVTVTVPLYGLAPEHHVDEVYPLLDALYDDAQARSSRSRVFLAGDSAGGGLALGQALRLRDEGRPAPAALILISPWVDVTMTNPAIPATAPLDHMLGAGGLAEAGRLWAGEMDVRSPLVSPLFGALDGLPPVYTYQGDHDILLADAKKLTRGIRSAGGHAELRLYRGAIHVFVGAPWTPEARRALRHIAGVLRA